MAKRRSHTRNMETRILADGLPAYYFIAPRAARMAGILASVPLGRDREAAIAKAADYNRILDAWRQGDDVVAPSPAEGTLDWAIRRFRDLRDRPSRQRRKPLSKKTKRDYDHYLDHLAEIRLSDGRRLGEVMLHEVGPREARQLYAIFGKADARGVMAAPRAGRNALQVCRRLWALVGCGELGLASNPFAGLDLGGREAREAGWRPEEVLAFVATARARDRRSLAAAALLSSALRRRPAATLRLTWRALADGRRAHPHLSARLEALLDEVKRRSAVALPRDLDRPIVRDEGTGRPYDARSFRKQVAEIRRAAGLPAARKFGDLHRSGITARPEAAATTADVCPGTGPAAVSRAPCAGATAAATREVRRAACGSWHTAPAPATAAPLDRPQAAEDRALATHRPGAPSALVREEA